MQLYSVCLKKTKTSSVCAKQKSNLLKDKKVKFFHVFILYKDKTKSIKFLKDFKILIFTEIFIYEKDSDG
jgi:hypothetical protein